MPITVGNITTASPQASPGSTLTVTTHNNNGDYLLVDILEAYNEVNDATGVTWNGTAMTFLGSVTDPAGGRNLYRYGLANPATGTRTLIITFGSSADVSAFITIRSFSGVNQTTPTGSTVTQTAIAASSISLNISSASGELVADAVGLRNDSSPTLTVGSGQTQTSNGVSGWGLASLDSKGGTSYKAGASSVTMSWSVSSATNLWMLATALKPASSGYTLNVSGAISPGGNLQKSVALSKSGGISPAGVISKAVAIVKTGTIASAGALAKQVAKSFAGSIDTAGTLRRTVSIIKSGIINSSGAVTKSVSKLFSGTVTSAGTVTVLRTVLLFFSGVVSPAGTLIKSFTKSFVGTLSPTGTIAKEVRKTLAGAINVIGGLITSLITPAGADLISVIAYDCHKNKLAVDLSLVADIQVECVLLHKAHAGAFS